eukprot:1142574-Pelagomonas_calceolata.AAC.1
MPAATGVIPWLSPVEAYTAATGAPWQRHWHWGRDTCQQRQMSSPGCPLWRLTQQRQVHHDNDIGTGVGAHASSDRCTMAMALGTGAGADATGCDAEGSTSPATPCGSLHSNKRWNCDTGVLAGAGADGDEEEILPAASGGGLNSSKMGC